jgi:hypothetical protein
MASPAVKLLFSTVSWCCFTKENALKQLSLVKLSADRGKDARGVLPGEAGTAAAGATTFCVLS